eukprot:11125930-Alexandrium_andersonii.AAC.1
MSASLVGSEMCIRDSAVAMRLGKAGGRLSPPVTEPPDAAVDCASARLQELAGSGRLCQKLSLIHI